jgi:hypothetical protein
MTFWGGVRTFSPHSSAKVKEMGELCKEPVVVFKAETSGGRLPCPSGTCLAQQCLDIVQQPLRRDCNYGPLTLAFS